jgi:hydroxyethylthiazole kinase-like uncharacterized protein yjeF
MTIVLLQKNMLPILTSKQIKELDTYTILNEPIASIDLMERAIRMLHSVFLRFKEDKIHVICGTGNNGGDGLVLARLLANHQMKICVSIADFGNKHSIDFAINLERLKLLNNTTINILKKAEDLIIEKEEILIDAIFGNGLSRILKGSYLEIVKKMNQSGNKIYSIDMPSGLLADKDTPIGKFVKAEKTYILEIPRVSLLNPNHRVNIYISSIGISPEFIKKFKTKKYLIEDYQDVILPKRDKHTYKNKQGHLCIIGGSVGMYGAPILSAKAGFKTGAGLVTCLVPEEARNIVHHHILEVMTLSNGKHYLHGDCPDLSKYVAFVVGPGMGKNSSSFNFLRQILKYVTKPMVIDADALNLIALNNALDIIPPNSILTPHPGEFKRLFGDWKNEKERLKKLTENAKKHQCVIVLKGTYTVIVSPNGEIYYNVVGSPSLATAGSGDVLSGVIGGLLAQGYPPLESAYSGVFHHGKSGVAFEGKPVLASQIADNLFIY